MAKAKSSARRKKKPAPCNAHKQAGDAYYLGNQFEQAIAEYSAALEDPLLESVLRATILSNRSAAHLKLSQPEFALIDADLSLLHNPGWHKAHLRRARALESLVMLEQAAEAYASAGKLDEAAEVERIHERSLIGASDDTDRYTVMANWLRGGGSRFDKLYLEYYGEEYRGVHSLVPIPKDEILLKVPLDCIMTTDVAKASTIGQAIQASGCKLMSTHSWLAAFLLQEKHAPESDWKEYIDILPKAYRSMPIFFNETELSYLKGSFSLEKISDRKETLDREFRNICRHIPAFAEYTYEGFVWARLVVITRIFGFYIKGRKTEGLVGMADMLNHQIPSEKDVKWSFSDEHNGFIMTATKEIARGVQIYDSYGRKCNHRFFVNYGFSLESNPDNEAMFCVGIPDGDPEYERKQALLGGFDMDAYEELQAPANLAHASCRLFIGYLRIAHARGQDLDRVPKSLDELEALPALGVDSELQVLHAIKAAAEQTLQGFDTTVAEDDQLLQDPLLSFNIRNAVLMRRGEKQVCLVYLDFVRTMLELLECPWKVFKNRALQSQGLKHPYDSYILRTMVPLRAAPMTRE